MKSAVVIGLAGLLLAGCQSGPKQGFGQVAGGVTGALIGSQFGSGSGKLAATALGAVVGTMIGGEIGRNSTRPTSAPSTMPNTRRSNMAIPARRSPGRIRAAAITARSFPGPGYKVNTYDCRDYTHTIYISGQPQVARGTACRQPDGTWKPVS